MKHRIAYALPALLLLASAGPGCLVAAPAAHANSPAMVKAEFIFERAPFPESHASSIVETREGLLAAWFGGTREKHSDVGIWTSRNTDGQWTPPKEVVTGKMAEDERRYPCWNPVLFFPREGPLHLFYKVGPSPSTWWGMLMVSRDQGRTWGPPKRLPKDILGPIRNKPVQLPDGTILCGSSSEDAGWRVHMERTRTLGEDWDRTKALNQAREFGAIQPTIMMYGSPNLIQILCRTKQNRIVESWSNDAGKTWSPFVRTALPNPNSSIDGVVLNDSRGVLVYNHTTSGRGLLNVAVTKDLGKTWNAALVLENEPGAEFSYPAIIQTGDGLLHVTYTWKRQRIKHVVLDPARFQLNPLN